MSTNFPASQDSFTSPNPTDKLNNPSHSSQHQNANDAITAVEAKLGTGASTPTNNTFLIGNGVGSSAFSALTSAQLAARLSDETGTGAAVFATTPTLVTPVLGAATGTSLALGGGTALTTTNQTGTGSLVLATSPTIATATLTGATLTGASLTSPKIITDLSDTNGNELFKVTATATAVNEFTVANAATGNFPVLSVTGGDTNVDGLLVGKGTGSFRHAGPYDGWVATNETLTYVSATTFTTASAALAAAMQVGDRLKLTQTTVKYFYVVGISGTTITVTGGTDYTLANAAITLPFYSHEASPTGFPTAFNYSPTWVGVTAGFTSVNRFWVFGRTCTIQVTRTTNQTSNATGLTATLPITAATVASMGWMGTTSQNVDNSAAVATMGLAQIASAATTVVLAKDGQPNAWTAAGTKGANFEITYEI